MKNPVRQTIVVLVSFIAGSLGTVLLRDQITPASSCISSRSFLEMYISLYWDEKRGASDQNQYEEEQALEYAIAKYSAENKGNIATNVTAVWGICPSGGAYIFSFSKNGKHDFFCTKHGH